ncbi:hypothetical protein MRB53_028474 [Persea americana]|uniref:Uncharacterized protein n=1 Tax=Persea americana TaxID=3435 RepID=A0ACC2KG46_PERAE|nr:hypothetical protein MRB53_028474 [Persea americana]
MSLLFSFVQIAILQEDKNALERLNKSKEAALVEAEKILKSAMERALIVEEVQNQYFELKRQIEICQALSWTLAFEVIVVSKEKRTLERELARAKVSANRVASVVENEWKDDSDKVMPVKQWLEEKRILQEEMQRLRDKLAVSERTDKAEAQLQDKLRLRLKTLERMPFLICCRKEGSCEVAVILNV